MWGTASENRIGKRQNQRCKFTNLLHILIPIGQQVAPQMGAVRAVKCYFVVSYVFRETDVENRETWALLALPVGMSLPFELLWTSFSATTIAETLRHNRRRLYGRRAVVLLGFAAVLYSCTAHSGTELPPSARGCKMKRLLINSENPSVPFAASSLTLGRIYSFRSGSKLELGWHY